MGDSHMSYPGAATADRGLDTAASVRMWHAGWIALVRCRAVALALPVSR